jgi:hypothetical protein
MSSNDFNYLRQDRLPQDGTIQPSTSDRHGQEQGSGSYYHQPTTVGISYPTDGHHQQYIQSRPLDNSNSSNYGGQWYNNTQVGATPNQIGGTGAAENTQVTGDENNTSRQAAEALSYDTSALGSLAYASGLQYPGMGTGRAAQIAANGQFRGTLPVVSHTQRQSAVQTHYQAQASSEETKAMRGLANQYLHTSRQAQQSGIDSYQPQQKHDHKSVHSSNSGQNSTSTSYALRQNQQSDPTVQEQRNHQTSNTEPSRVVAPISSTQQHRQIDPRALLSSSTRANAIQHEQHPQSPLPSTPTTVNPSHVYNPYHEYRTQIEAVTNRAKQAILYVTNSNVASNIQSHQEYRQLAAERTGRNNTLEVQNEISIATPNGPNQTPIGSQVGEMEESRAQEIANEDIEDMKKREMIQKMMQLMQEDPTIFNQAVEQVKNVSTSSHTLT